MLENEPQLIPPKKLSRAERKAHELINKARWVKEALELIDPCDPKIDISQLAAPSGKLTELNKKYGVEFQSKPHKIIENIETKATKIFKDLEKNRKKSSSESEELSKLSDSIRKAVGCYQLVGRSNAIAVQNSNYIGHLQPPEPIVAKRKISW
jgi:hypothetical protein